MKKAKAIIALLLITTVLSSCATVFGGRVNTYQRTKPQAGQQQRRLRVGAFIADILLFWPGAVVDFATCAIYKPMPAPVDVQPVAPATTVSGSK
jgi:hypothetical protein